ncbi:aminotransferase class I/II-fold pyridoxal phosphate-dependent enzyme [Roseovarius sp. C7]|uniref:aminotransferase class I/II-fold pyridoxal phosphate-dependent enzyme n=1 Tax=Roseovarius sp. C7 TaxID=3398643 RepID=UPI0039F69555
MNIEQQMIASGARIRDAMQKLEGAPVKLCVLVDDDGRLVRTVVDGDLRRALLAGLSLDSLVEELPEQGVVSLAEGAPPEAVLRYFQEYPAVSAIVVTNPEGRPTGLIQRKEHEAGILLSPPHMGMRETTYVQKAFEDNWIAPAGPNLAAFEEALKPASGRQHTLALSSGTAAIHLALRVLNIGANDRVYVSDLTFAASLQPILYEKAKPVLINSEPDSWNMSPQALERRLKTDAEAGCLPKAVIVVHLYGQSANLDAILPLTEAYGIPVIEDAAESLGATFGNRASGAHGLMAAFSFNGNKIITTSGGGALVSDREDLIEKARNLATQGRDYAEHYQHSQIAYNYRMSNVLAGIGLGQLELLAQRVERRREIFETYRSHLSEVPGIEFQAEPAGSRGNRWLTVISLDPDEISRHPYQLLRDLRSKGIEEPPGVEADAYATALQGAGF